MKSRMHKEDFRMHIYFCIRMQLMNRLVFYALMVENIANGFQLLE